MIEVINPTLLAKPVNISEMEIGVLYKLAEGHYSTVYIKTFDGKLVWFEPNNRVNTGYLSDNRKYVRAPEGTKVIISN